MSKYTAGPWGFRTNPCHGDADEVVDLSSHWIDGPSGKPIANIYEYYHGESEANTRLIAAAPEMYEALKQAVVICELMMNGGQKRDICWKTGLHPMLTAALAKAGG